MDKFVLEVAIEYQRSMSLVGRKFRFPQAHDITATYPYRSIKAFVSKCKTAYGFDDDMVKETVKIVVKYARENKLLNAGPAILNRSDIIDICCKILSRELNDKEYLTKQFTEMNAFLDSKTANRYLFFNERSRRKGYPNLIALRSNNTITDSFICLSKSAMTVLNNLECSERAVISSLLDLAKLRLRIISRLGADEIKLIFGADSNVQ